MTMEQNLVEIGWIPYLNLVPFYCELRRLAGDTLNFVAGHPSVVSNWLMDGTVQLAPASSIALIRDEKLRAPIALGIASDGPVQSVYIGLHEEHELFLEFVRKRQLILSDFLQEQLPTRNLADVAIAMKSFVSSRVNFRDFPGLRLTPASAASVALTEILMHLWCGQDGAFKILSRNKTVTELLKGSLNAGEKPMELVIGDEALRRRHEFWKVLDLGQIWHDLTGLPFVFGLWQSRLPRLPEALAKTISDAAAVAHARMQIEPEAYFPEVMPKAGNGTLIDLRSYWSVIQYKLTSRHFKSLSLYYHLYKQILGADNDLLATKLMTLSKSDLFGAVN